MRKLAPAQVSYQDNFLILYRVYMMMGHFISCLFEGTLHVNKTQVQFKIANITHALSQSIRRPISHPNGGQCFVFTRY